MIKALLNSASYDIEFDNDIAFNGTVNSIEFKLDAMQIGKNRFHIIKHGKSYNIAVEDINPDTKIIKLCVNNRQHIVELQTSFDLLLKKLGLSESDSNIKKELKAPMPGLIIDIRVAVGQEVAKGQTLYILEAMKMENNIKSEFTGVIKEICSEKGKPVDKNQVVIKFE